MISDCDSLQIFLSICRLNKNCKNCSHTKTIYKLHVLINCCHQTTNIHIYPSFNALAFQTQCNHTHTHTFTSNQKFTYKFMHENEHVLLKEGARAREVACRHSRLPAFGKREGEACAMLAYQAQQ